jgi:hypothetical protein
MNVTIKVVLWPGVPLEHSPKKPEPNNRRGEDNSAVMLACC